MPAGLPDAAYAIIHGPFTEDQCKGVFEPEIESLPMPFHDKNGKTRWDRSVST